MHELSIAQNILKTVLGEIQSQNLPPVRTIGLKIGVLSDVLPDALEFGFDALKKETILAETELAIERTPVGGECRDCNEKFAMQELIFSCPACQSRSIEMHGGQELDITFLEVEQTDEPEYSHGK